MGSLEHRFGGGSVLVCSGCSNRPSMTGWLKRQKFISTCRQSLEVRAELPFGWFLMRTLFLVAGGHLLAVSWHRPLSMCHGRRSLPLL